MLSFAIPLTPRTKKNSQRIIKCGNYHKIMPSKAYEQYERDCIWFMPALDTPIDRPVNVRAIYYMDTHRRVDLTNLNEALHDILVHYGVLADDNSTIIVSTDGSRVSYDKTHPRTEVWIEKLEEK